MTGSTGNDSAVNSDRTGDKDHSTVASLSSDNNNILSLGNHCVSYKCCFTASLNLYRSIGFLTH